MTTRREERFTYFFSFLDFFATKPETATRIFSRRTKYACRISRAKNQLNQFTARATLAWNLQQTQRSQKNLRNR